MDRADHVAAALVRAGEAARIQRPGVPEIEDPAVHLGGPLHVQVGDTYLILVRHNADGTFTFFPEAASVEDLLRQIREARAEPGAAPAAPHPEPGATARRAAPGDGSAAPSLPFAWDGLPTRDQLIAAGAALHRSPVDGADYVLIAPTAARPSHAVLRLDGAGAASVVAESTTEAGATRSLEGYLDGTHRAAAERFFAWLEAREAAVRTEVADPLHAAGYRVYHTGGHCLAWMRGLSESDPHSYILISNEDELDGDPAAGAWSIGRYDGEGWINIDQTFTLAEAIRVAELLPPAAGPDGEPLEAAYATLAAALAALAGSAVQPDG